MSRHQAATTIQARVRGRQARTRAINNAKPQTLAWAIHEVVEDSKEEDPNASGKVVIDRERLCCDILNTAVMGALVGGFALSNMQSTGEGILENCIYLCSCLAVHACTCSCLTSALLYRVAVLMHDDAVPAWASKHQLLLKLPLVKFGMGCISYLLSVVLISFKDLDHSDFFRYACLTIGVMSMSTVLGTLVFVYPPPMTQMCKRPPSRVVPERKFP